MAEKHVQKEVSRSRPIFAHREEGGRRLVEFMDPAPEPDAVVLGVPRGGVPVAKPLADALDCALYPILTRKLPIPDSPEAGFGAVSLETGRVLNDSMVRRAGLGEERMEEIVRRVREELRRRAREYDMGLPEPDLSDRHVYLVDDGLATGYTMIAAAREVQAARPRRLTLAVPVSPGNTLDRVAELFDELFCLYCQTSLPFGVAGFYARFEEMSDEQVRRNLRQANPERSDNGPE